MCSHLALEDTSTSKSVTFVCSSMNPTTASNDQVEYFDSFCFLVAVVRLVYWLKWKFLELLVCSVKVYQSLVSVCRFHFLF